MEVLTLFPRLVISSFAIMTGSEYHSYSRVSNESTGTLEKNRPKIQPVRNFFRGTIDGNSRFGIAVLLFQPPIVLQNIKKR